MFGASKLVESLGKNIYQESARRNENTQATRANVVAIIAEQTQLLENLQAQQNSLPPNEPVRRAAQLRERMIEIQNIVKQRETLAHDIEMNRQVLQELENEEELQERERFLTSTLQSLNVELVRYLLEHERSFSPSMRSILREKLTSPEGLALYDVVALLIQQVESYYDRPEVRLYYQEVQEEYERINAGDFLEERITALEERDRELQLKLYDEFLERKEFVLEKAFSASEMIGALDPELVLRAIPEIQYIDTLDEVIRVFQDIYPPGGITVPELRHNVIGLAYGSSWVAIPQADWDKTLQNLPAFTNGDLLKYHSEIAYISDGQEKIAKVPVLTFSGLVYLLENYFTLSSSNRDGDAELVVAGASLQALISRYNNSKLPYTVRRTFIPSMEEQFYEQQVPSTDTASEDMASSGRAGREESAVEEEDLSSDEPETITLYMPWDIKDEKAAELASSDLYEFIVNNIGLLEQVFSNILLDTAVITLIGETSYRELLSYAQIPSSFYESSILSSAHSGHVDNSYIFIEQLLEKLHSISDLQLVEDCKNDIYSLESPFCRLFAILLWNEPMLIAILAKFRQTLEEDQIDEPTATWTTETMVEYLHGKKTRGEFPFFELLDINSVVIEIEKLKKKHSSFPKINAVLDKISLFNTESHNEYFSADKGGQIMTFKPSRNFRIVFEKDQGVWIAYRSGTAELLSSTNASGMRIRK